MSRLSCLLAFLALLLVGCGTPTATPPSEEATLSRLYPARSVSAALAREKARLAKWQQDLRQREAALQAKEKRQGRRQANDWYRLTRRGAAGGLTSASLSGHRGVLRPGKSVATFSAKKNLGRPAGPIRFSTFESGVQPQGALPTLPHQAVPQAPTAAPVYSPATTAQPYQPSPPAYAPARDAAQSGTASQPAAATVYITRTGKKYHGAGCRYLRQSQIAMSLKGAQRQGYTPCSVCGPPSAPADPDYASQVAGQPPAPEAGAYAVPGGQEVYPQYWQAQPAYTRSGNRIYRSSNGTRYTYPGQSGARQRSSGYGGGYAGGPVASQVVFITRTGAKYHAGGCRYLRQSQIPVPLRAALQQGYSACSVCGGG